MGISEQTVSQPSGTVTFLFTDIQGSTRAWAAEPERMREAVAAHDRIVRGRIEDCRGYVFATGGDGFAAAFETVDDALRAAIDAQRDIREFDWPTADPLRVRMGLHTGTAQERDGNYFGPEVNRAARLMSIGHGGQILVSGPTSMLVESDAILVGLGEHRLADIDEPEHVFQVGDGHFPPLRAVGLFLCTVPVARSELIGREQELTVLQQILGESRLVTLTGTGGTGKTRLAFEAARAAVAGFEGGVWLVDLTVVTAPEAVGSAFASALEVPAGDDPLAATIDAIGDSVLLLVVDNCEHVIDAAAAALDQILVSCPAVSVLATSRESLELDGEVVHTVPPLDTGGSAIELFNARVASVGVDPQEFDRDNVEALVRRLDGLPLAIELAAARARTLRPLDLISYLDEGGDLTTGRRRGRRRHETLRGTIEWSYQLLEPSEQLVLRRVSAFESIFPLDGIATISGLSQGAATDAADGLVSKSLLQRTPPPGGDGESSWFRLLETVRDFAVGKLESAGESETARDLLLEHVDRLARRWDSTDDRVRDVLIPLIAQGATIDAAVEWAASVGDPIATAKVLNTASMTWMSVQDRANDRRFEQLADLLEGGGLPADMTGHLLVTTAQHALARMQIDRALAFATRAKATAGVATVFGAMAGSMQAFMTAFVDPTEGRRLSGDAVQMLRVWLARGEDDADRPSWYWIDDGIASAWVLWHHAEVLAAVDDPEGAIEALREVTVGGTHRGSYFYGQGLSSVLWNSIRLGRTESALAMIDAAEIPFGGHDAMARSVALASLGEVHEAELEHLAFAETQGARFNDHLRKVWLAMLGMIAFHAGDQERARRLLQVPIVNRPSVMVLKRQYLEELGVAPTSDAILPSVDAATEELSVSTKIAYDELTALRAKLTE